MKNAKQTALLVVTAALALSACGGSGDGSAANPLVSYNTVKVFSDGAGVARGVGADGSRVEIIAPDIAEIVAASKNVTQQDVENILSTLDPNDFPIVQVLNTNANLRQGALTIDGIVMNVTIFEDLGGNSEAITLDVPNYGSALLTGGQPLGSVPTGSFVYSGTLGIAPRSFSQTPSVELGAFTLDANFNSGTFDFSGSTASNTMSGSGLINISNGQISANNIGMTTNGTNRTASMYGNFRGDTAQGVSGVFHTNEANPTHSGGFAGSRE